MLAHHVSPQVINPRGKFDTFSTDKGPARLDFLSSLTCALAHVGTAIEAAESVPAERARYEQGLTRWAGRDGMNGFLHAVDIRLAHTPAVGLPAPALVQGQEARRRGGARPLEVYSTEKNDPFTDGYLLSGRLGEALGDGQGIPHSNS